jgi:hypothetical protein
MNKALAFLFASLFVLAACGGNRAGEQPTTPGTGTPGQSKGPHYESLVVHVLRATADGKQSELGKLERPLTDFRDEPVSLLVRKARQAGEGNPDALARFEARFEIGRSKIALPAFDLDCSKPAKCIAREWLDLELSAPGVPSRHVERVLFENPGDAEPPAFRRHTIVAVPGSITRDEVTQRAKKHLGGMSVAQRKAKAEALEREAQSADGAKQQALLARVDDTDVSATLGNLVALEHAAESDVMTDGLARTLGVTVEHAVPRILITTMQAENAGDSPSLSLDLRLDEVAASSDDVGAMKLFQRSRGLLESEIEGSLLRGLGGPERAVSTALLMKEAGTNGIEVFPVRPDNPSALKSMDLPAPFAKQVESALKRGHVVVLPRSAVDLAGKSRWGFWDIDPETGATIGVMEGGEHQGLMEGPLINKSVAQSKELGFCLGFMMGFIAFEWELMGRILEYGEVTPQLIAELEADLKTIACSNFCNIGVQAKVEIEVTGCKKALSAEKVLNPDSFCREYKSGFECAVGVLLAGLTSPGQAPKPKVNSEATLELGCYKIGPATD